MSGVFHNVANRRQPTGGRGSKLKKKNTHSTGRGRNKKKLAITWTNHGKRRSRKVKWEGGVGRGTGEIKEKMKILNVPMSLLHGILKQGAIQ